MLDPPEKTIREFQGAGFGARDQFQLRENRERFQRARFLEERVPRPMQKLQSLHDKFDFANPARAQLHVSLDIFLADNLALNSPLDRGDFLEHIGRRTLGINEGLMLAQKFVSQLPAAGDAAGFDQREPLPGFAEAGIIVFHALERTSQRSGGAFRSETQIDAKERAGRVGGGEGLDNFRAELIEPLVMSEIGRDLSFLAVEKDDVDIGTVIQLPAAELAQAENRKFGLGSAEPMAQLRVPVSINLAQTDFGQQR